MTRYVHIQSEAGERERKKCFFFFLFPFSSLKKEFKRNRSICTYPGEIGDRSGDNDAFWESFFPSPSFSLFCLFLFLFLSHSFSRSRPRPPRPFLFVTTLLTFELLSHLIIF